MSALELVGRVGVAGIVISATLRWIVMFAIVQLLYFGAELARILRYALASESTQHRVTW